MKSLIVNSIKQNKILLITALLITVILTFLGSGRIFAVIVYTFILALFATKNIAFFNTKSDEEEKKKSFNALFLILLLMSLIFIIIFVIGILIKEENPCFIPRIPFLNVCILGNETFYSFLASCFFGVSFVFCLIRLLLCQLNLTNEIKKIILIFSTIYIPILYEAVYLVFLLLSQLSKDMKTVHLYYLIFSILFFVITLTVNLLKISKAKQVFITGTFKKRERKHKFLKI